MRARNVVAAVLLLGAISSEVCAGGLAEAMGRLLVHARRANIVEQGLAVAKRAAWVALPVYAGVVLAVASQVEIAPEARRLLIGNEELIGQGIMMDSTSHYERDDLLASDYSGYVVHYVWEGEHATATAVHLELLGDDLLVLKSNDHPAHIAARHQIMGVRIDDSEYLGKFVSVPVVAAEEHVTHDAHDAVAAQQLLAQQDRTIHGKVAQAFTSDYFLVRASFTVDTHGETTTLADPLYFLAPADKATFVEVVVPTSTKCEQCHDAAFPNEDNED